MTAIDDGIGGIPPFYAGTSRRRRSPATDCTVQRAADIVAVVTMSHDGWRRFLFTAMLLSLGWALLIGTTGGFTWEIAGLRLSSRDPVRPLVAGIVAALMFWYAAPATVARAIDRLERAIARRAALLACAAAVATVIAGVQRGTYAAGGADSYGYVSESDLWLAGHLKVNQSAYQRLGPPFDTWTLSPLGYRPGLDPWTVVPTYSPGLPLLMAAARVGGGPAARFWVVPVLGGLTVLLTFLLGRLLVDDLAGAGGALLVAASPVFVMYLLSPMSDVPAAAAWTLALVFALGKCPIAAGLATSLAIVIRPNLVPLAVAVGFIASRAPAADVGARAVAVRAARFAAAALPGAIGIAALNSYLYGGPLESGYGSLGGLYSWRYIPTNVTHYGRWLLDTETPLVFAAILPLAFGRFTAPRTPGHDRAVRAGLALFFLLLAGSYVVYWPFEAWWYLRFLLPGLPLALAMAAGWLRTIMRVAAGSGRGRTLAWTAIVGIVLAREAAVARARGAFDIRTGEQRYVTIGRDVSAATPSNAVFFAMQQSGSLRFYTGRLTVRYDLLPEGSLDRAVEVLRARGYHPYFLLERWEEPAFVARFAGTRAGRLDWRPSMKWISPSEVALYDPSEQ
jgi:hypothetical protein